jgi:LacI family transcriptional regulator
MRPPESRNDRRWRGPTILDIARVSGVGTATVDRVLNGRGGVREATRDKVLAVVAQLNGGTGPEPMVASVRRRIAFLTESGPSFNRSLQEAVEEYGATREDVACDFTAISAADVDPVRFAQQIERTAAEADGLVLVAREDLTINRAVRAVSARGVPVVCLATDLPSSGRLAFVGSDQTAAGASAAYLMGRVIGERAGKVLLVISAPYRGQEERELGFRRVLRAEFAHLNVEERVNSNDDIESAYQNVRRYIEEHGPPVGVYNVAAGNVGIARALGEEGLGGKAVFVGHELNANSRTLLESGGMDFVIGHDVDREVALSAETILAHLDGRPPRASTRTRVRIYTKFNCDG